MTVPTATMKDWEQFYEKSRDLMHEGAFGKPHFSFRGQARKEWPLRPALSRVLVDAAADEDTAVHVERIAEREFRGQARYYLPSGFVSMTASRVDWWMIMQHYGAPTRLLDWSRSLFVAAYFAVNSDPDSDGAVWIVFPSGMIVKSMGYLRRMSKAGKPDYDAVLKDEKAPLGPFFVGPEDNTDRMAAQQTSFSFSTRILADHDSLLEKAARRHSEIEFRKIIIPKEQKSEFVRQLRRMNITGRALFPGIDGLGRSVAELVRVEAAR